MSRALIKSRPDLHIGTDGLLSVDPPMQLAGAIGLRRGRVHETSGDASEMFAVMAATLLEGMIIWISPLNTREIINPHGLAAFIDPARLMLVTTVSRRELLWSAEQALHLKDACVVVDMEEGPDLKESQRLQLAAEEGKSLGVLLLRGHARTSAAETRWHCSSLPGNQTAWRWACQKNKRDKTGAWQVRWTEQDNAENSFHLVADAAH